MKKSRVIASVVALALVMSSVCVPGGGVYGAKKVAFKKKVYNVTVGKSVKVSLKNAPKKAKVSWKTGSKKVASIGKKTLKGNAYAFIKGNKKGKAVITATVKVGKKKTPVTCTVNVSKESVTPEATPTPLVTATVVPTPPVVNNTVAPEETAANVQVSPSAPAGTGKTPNPKKTSSPVKTAAPTASPTAKPTNEPLLVNPHKVDLSAEGAYAPEVLQFGADVNYNAKSGCIEAKMHGQQGFFIKNDAPEEERDKYPYVMITYELYGTDEKGETVKEDAKPDVNIYLGDGDIKNDDYGTGLGESPKEFHSEHKITNYPIGEEYSVLYGIDETFAGNMIKSIKVFHFSTTYSIIKVKDVTFYMDGSKVEQDDYEAAAVSGSSITIDGVASEECWNQAKENTFVSKIATDSGTYLTSTRAKVKFVHDFENFYFFVDVKDSDIDKTGTKDYERDGLDILFDGDGCKKFDANTKDANWTANEDAFHYRFTGLDKESEKKTGLAASVSQIVGGGTEGKATEGIEIKYALTDKGYSVEGRIPFAAEKEAGSKVCLDIVIQDCMNGVRNAEYYLFPVKDGKVKSYWNNHNADFATVVLMPGEEEEEE